MGPALVRNENGPETTTEFEWEVQMYRFNFTYSNYFYFLLREGGPENLMNASARYVTSPYFNITDDSPSSSSTTNLAKPTSLSKTPPESGQDEASDTDTSDDTTGLSVGAQAGIGVGVSIIGIIGIVCAVLWFRYLKKKQTALADLQDRSTLMSQPHNLNPSGQWKPQGNPPMYYYATEMGTVATVPSCPLLHS
ncbi:hypothetical protein C8A00DRAFT_31396 [Chaetomidium leptoderma]|uniref:Mid2 domain-containing protein n=1 Tax=Chaetomidium leptoderma TaxID=669021 RepID=A0AAN7A0H2_9PEZI|nr:hypothetical protein C8A00DRAFT_31396 [Chaetomidium leptoderma]